MIKNNKKQTIIITTILILLSPFLLYFSLDIYFKIEERNEQLRVQEIIKNLDYIPPVPDEELKAKIFFETNELTQEEQTQIVEYLLQNKRKVIINADKVEFVSIDINNNGHFNICRNWKAPLNVLLIIHVKGPDINKTGTIYLSKMPENTNWQECITHMGPL